MQVVAHAFGHPMKGRLGSVQLPWSTDESQGIAPGLRAFLPVYRGMSDAEWKDFVFRSGRKTIFAQRLDALNGSLPPEGLWPEFEVAADVSVWTRI